MEIFPNNEVEKDIQHLQTWFENNTNLPNKIDRIYLARFYHRTSQNVEETKTLLEDHYSMRLKYPNIYFNRDPESEDTLHTASWVYLIPLPGMTPDKNRVSLIKLKNADPKMVHFIEDLRSFIMINDCRFSLPDIIDANNISYFSECVVQIIDMEGFTMKHMTRVSLSILPSFLKYLQKVCPVIIKSIHLINCPSYINRMFAIVKPFLKKETVEMMHFHNHGLDSLFDFVPREMLNDEYGGSAGKIQVLAEDFQNSVRAKRDYIIDPNYWTVMQK